MDQILAYADSMPSNECEVFIPHMEGAPSRVPADATAFAHRKTPFVLNIHTRWQDNANDNKCLKARDFHRATEPFSQGVYVNFISEEGKARVKDAYTPKVWQRLVEIKKRYDPDIEWRM